MERPDKTAEAELNSIGVYTLSKEETSQIESTKKQISLLVEIGFPKEVELSAPDFDVRVLNRRGIFTLFSDFGIVEREDQKILHFYATQNIPDDYNLQNPEVPLAMSFIDLCWNTGAEPTNVEFANQVVTKPRQGCKGGDLGWVLPSRYADSVIGCLGKLNDVFLSGTLQEAILYGPFITTRE